MIQVDIPMTFAMGGILAGAARRQLVTGRADLVRGVFWRANQFFVLTFLWVPIYFAVAYFGWETAFLWWHADSVATYPAFIPLFVVALVVGFNAGLAAGCRWIRRGRPGVNRAVYLTLMFYSVAWVVLAGERSRRLGTFAEFMAGQAPLASSDSTFLVMLVLTLAIWMGGLVVCALRFLRAGRVLGGLPS